MTSRSLEPRSYRSIRPLTSTSSLTRPVSVGSNLSGISSSSSITGERRRRSAALLERELGSNPLEDTPGRRSIRHSLTRAEEVLRASERQRELERRKERVGLRAQQLGRSTRLLEQLDMDDTTEELNMYGLGLDSSNQPDRLLRKARSIPSELLLSPSFGKRSKSLTSHNVAQQQHQLLSRPASSVAILGNQIAAPATRPSRQPFDVLVDRSDYLNLPAAEPTSKFSASSTDSLVHVLAPGGEQPLRFKDRARSFNQASKTFGNKFKSKTPSKLNLRKKPSLAGIFRDPPEGGSEKGNKPNIFERSRSISRNSTRFHNIGHQPNTSVSSSAPSTDRESKPRETSSRLGFFRSALRDSTTTSSSGSRPRSAGTISPSIISAPLSVSSGGGGAQSSSDKRISSSTDSSAATSNAGGERKRGWVSKLGRTLRGKNVAAKQAIYEDDKENEGIQAHVVQLAEKVKVGGPSPRANTMRPPSRVPVTSLFSGKTKQAQPPVRPRRPSSGPISSDDTTFYGHRVAEERVLGTALASNARRVRAKVSSPVSKVSAPKSTFTSFPPSVQLRSNQPIGPFSNLVVLPSADVAPPQTASTRKLTLNTFEREVARGKSSDYHPSSLLPVSPTSSSGETPPSPARSFRSPSPARFRDLVPSGTASSPDKNDSGLPTPPRGGSPKSVTSRGSPRRRAALGPEQIICMTDARERTGPISEVRGATTDLADLLSGLEETQDYDRSRSFVLGTPPRTTSEPEIPPLPPILQQRHILPHVESLESLRSTVSDVPDDLKDLINAVDDHISEVEIPSFVVDGHGMRDRGFADEGFDMFSFVESDSDSSQDERFAPAFNPDRRLLSVDEQHTNYGFTSSEGATSTMNFDSTVSSFEGHVSTAAGVLRGMLDGSLPRLSTGPTFAELCNLPEEESESETEEEESDQASLRDSVREALEVGRPSAGDRMFERFDSEVSLSALVDPSLPPSPAPVPSRPSLVAANFSLGHFRHESVVSSSEGSESTGLSVVHSSPTPNPAGGRPLRQSLARYSQERYPLRHPSHRIRPISEQFSSGSSERNPRSEDHTTSSSAPSSHSTKLSVNSMGSSPCPVPRTGRIPMLTRPRPPPLQPSFKFPSKDDKLAVINPRNSEDTASRIVFDGPSSVLPEGEPVEVEEEKDTSALYAARQLPMDRLVDSNPQFPCLETGDFDRVTDTPALSPLSLSGDASPSPLKLDESPHLISATGPFSNLISLTIVEENEDLAASPLRNLGLHLRLQESPPAFYRDSSATSLYSARDSDDSRFHEESERGAEDGYEDVLDSEDDYDLIAQDPEITRKFVHLNYEAETEIRRSQTLWPDTDRSREAVALFDATRTYPSILDFLFSSQSLFPSPPHLARLSSFVPIAFADPPTPHSPISPVSPVSPVKIPSPLRDSTRNYLSSTPPSPEAQPSIPFIADPQSAKPTQPLRKVLGNKSVNVALSSSTSAPKEIDALSPFTALPPRLGSKLRGIRVKVSPTKKREEKKVDTSFVGDGASKRRQTQWEAAARKLEGTGRPEEQRSDDDTDDTGVLEAKGEATTEFTFAKTPPTSIVRPRKPRRALVSALR